MAPASGAPAVNPRQRRILRVAAVSVPGAAIVQATRRRLDAVAMLPDCSGVGLGRTAP